MILLFLDAETTGLDPDPAVHVPWEIAATRAEHTEDGRLVIEATVDFFVMITPLQAMLADPVGMAIGNFAARYKEDEAKPIGAATWEINRLCDGRPHLVGSVPSFDDRRVGDMMRRCGVIPRWHYHNIDVENLAMGYLLGKGAVMPPLPWKSEDLSRAIGVNPDDFPRHTAMGDVEWSIAQYVEVFDLKVERT